MYWRSLAMDNSLLEWHIVDSAFQKIVAYSCNIVVVYHNIAEYQAEEFENEKGVIGLIEIENFVVLIIVTEVFEMETLGIEKYWVEEYYLELFDP